MNCLRSGASAAFCVSLVILSLSSCSVHMARQEAVPVDYLFKKAQACISMGDYKKALDVYSDAYDKYHHNQDLLKHYAKTGGQIRNAADRAYQRKDFAEAGRIYRILYNSHITAKDFSASLSFDGDYLNSQMKACSKALMEIGLAKYRAWEFEEAISIWKKALSFYPEDKEIKIAIDTASIQLESLNKINQPKEY